MSFKPGDKVMYGGKEHEVLHVISEETLALRERYGGQCDYAISYNCTPVKKDDEVPFKFKIGDKIKTKYTDYVYTVAKTYMRNGNELVDVSFNGSTYYSNEVDNFEKVEEMVYFIRNDKAFYGPFTTKEANEKLTDKKFLDTFPKGTRLFVLKQTQFADVMERTSVERYTKLTDVIDD